MFCYKCGENLPDEAEFCIKCGENLKSVKEMNGIAPSVATVQSAPPQAVSPVVSPPVTPPPSPSTPPPTPRANRVTPFPDDEPSNDTKKISPTVIALGAGAILLSAALLFVMVRLVFPGDKSSEEDTATKEEAVTATPETAKPEEVVVAVDPEELYGEILETIRQVANDQNFDHTTVGLPYYLGMSWFDGSLADMSYDFVDVNGDNVPELFVFIGEAMVYGTDSTLVSCYTVIDGEVVSLIASGERFGYFLTKDKEFGYWGSSGAADHSVALLHLNKNGVLEYQTYINTTYEDYMISNSPVYDYLIAIENNGPNYSNRQIATETELAEFYRIYEGDKYQFNYTPFVTKSDEISPNTATIRSYDFSNAPFPYLRIAVPDFRSYFTDGEFYTDPNSLYYDGYNAYESEYSGDTSIYRDGYIQYLISLGFSLSPEGQEEGFFFLSQQQGDDFVSVVIRENFYKAIDPNEYVRVSISMS